MTPVQPISDRDALRRYYDRPSVSTSYLERRTVQPVGWVLHAAQVAYLNGAIARHRPATVLEIAPGPARLTTEIRGRFHGVALERSWHMIERARARLGDQSDSPWRLAQGDAFELPFADERFDLIYTVRFVKHFQLPDRARLYAEIRRVLSSRGRFVVEAQNRAVCLPHRLRRGSDRYPVYDELFTRSDLAAELAEHGFAVEDMCGMLKHYEIQMQLNRLRRLRLSAAARLLILALERLDGEPNTWMVTCRKR